MTPREIQAAHPSQDWRFVFGSEDHDIWVMQNRKGDMLFGEYESTKDGRKRTVRQVLAPQRQGNAMQNATDEDEKSLSERWEFTEEEDCGSIRSASGTLIVPDDVLPKETVRRIAFDHNLALAAARGSKNPKK